MPSNEQVNWSFAHYLDAVASRTPTPGGGGVTAAVGALAVVLGRMVAAYSIKKDTDAATQLQVEAFARRLQRADELLRRLLTEDARAYEALSEIGKTIASSTSPASSDSEKVSALSKRDAANFLAASIPLEMAAVAVNVLGILDEMKNLVNPRLMSDLAVSAVFAEATVRAAGYTVDVNVREIVDSQTGEKIIHDLSAMRNRAATFRDSLERFVRLRSEGDSTKNR